MKQLFTFILVTCAFATNIFANDEVIPERIFSIAVDGNFLDANGNLDLMLGAQT
jgi:hypothetical protein